MNRGVIIGGILIPLLLIAYFRLPEEEIELTFSSGSEGGMYIQLAPIIAELLEENIAYLKIKVTPSSGSAANIKRLDEGAADLALMQNDIVGGSNIRSIVSLYKEPLHFLVRNGLEIDDVYELQGKKIFIGSEGSGSSRLVLNFLQYFGMNEESVEIVKVSPSEASEMILNEQLDAMLWVSGIGDPSCRKVIHSGKVHFMNLGIPGEKGGILNGYIDSYPYVNEVLIPKYSYPTYQNGTLSGLPNLSINTLSVDAVLVGRKNLPEQLVRDIVQTLFENKVHLIRKFSYLSHMTEQASNLQFPYHKGAESYYSRNDPSFITEYAETMAFILSACIAMYGAAMAIHKVMQRRKKDRVDVYYLKIDKILSELMGEDVSEERLGLISAELNEIRSITIKKLVNEELMADDSFRIFQTMMDECRDLIFKMRMEYIQK